MREIPYEILEKKTCNNVDNLCYHLKPYSTVDLALDKDNTKKEKAKNLERFQKSCSNRNGVLDKCCSKNKKDILKLDKLLRKLKKPEIYGKTEYNQQGNLESMVLCTKDKLKDCGKGYKKLNAYEMCKIPGDINIESMEGETLTEFNKDCYESQCNPQEKLAGIDGKYDEEYTFEFDKQVAQAIKYDKLENFQYYLKEDPKLTSRAMTHSSDGNTVYHEAFQKNAKHIVVHLFKTVTPENINKLNSKGETLLHMAMKTDNPNAIQMCLKLGADINAVNNYGETPIFDAIRNGHYHNVLVSLNKYADIYHKNKKEETPFIVACENKKRHLDIVRLLVDNGANIDDLNSEGKTIIASLLEKEELNSEKLTKKNKEAKDKIDLNIEDEKIRTLLQNIKIKNLGLDLTKELSSEDSKKLEGILYTLEGKDKYEQENYKFTLDIDFNADLKHPEDLHYPKNLKEKHMKPYNTGELNFSHEPYYLKYKNMHTDKLVELKKIIQLTQWDNKKNQEEKEKIIDDIMTGKISFDNYKYRVFTDNGITQEQDHLLENIDEKSLFAYEKPESNEKIVEIKSRRTTDEEGTVTETPFNINYGTQKELNKKRENENLDNLLSQSQKEDYEKLLLSPNISEEEKDGLLKIIQNLLQKININIDNNKRQEIEDLKNKLLGKTKDLQHIENINMESKVQNRNFLLTMGIIFAILTIILLVYLLKKKKLA